MDVDLMHIGFLTLFWLNLRGLLLFMTGINKRLFLTCKKLGSITNILAPIVKMGVMMFAFLVMSLLMVLEMWESTTDDSDDTQLTQTELLVKSDENQGTDIFGLSDNSYEENGDAKLVDKGEDTEILTYFVEEKPAVKQVETFYFVKHQRYEDLDLKRKIELVHNDFQKLNQAVLQITETFEKKKAERSLIIEGLRPLNDRNMRLKQIIGEKRKELDRLETILEDPHGANIGRMESRLKEELDSIIRSLDYRFNHALRLLDEEQVLARELNGVADRRENAILNTKNMSCEEVKIEKIKIEDDIKAARTEQQKIWEKIMVMHEDLKPLNDELSSLEEELKTIADKRNYMAKSLCSLKKAQEETVEAFMSEWSNNKSLQEDYKNEILASLASRQLSNDGRIVILDDPSLFKETPSPTEASPVKEITEPAGKDDESATQHDITPDHKAENEAINEFTEKENEVNLTNLEDITNINDAPIELPDIQEIDTTKPKEIRREEEIAKAKLAMERKKKIAAKAADKAAVRAQREAERKLKEKERKAKKRGGGSIDSHEDSMERDNMFAETPEKDAANDTAKHKELKDNRTSRIALMAMITWFITQIFGFGKCRNTSKSSNQIPKVILKRRRSQAYWSWAISGTIFALVFVGICYILTIY